MKKIYIFQSGKTSDSPDGKDEYSPLSTRGVKRAIRARTDHGLPIFDLVISSPALRSISTAYLLRQRGSQEIFDSCITIIKSLYELFRYPKIINKAFELRESSPQEWYDDDEIGGLVKKHEQDYVPQIRGIIESSNVGSNILIVAHPIVCNIIAKNLVKGYGMDERMVMSRYLKDLEGIKIEIDTDLIAGVYRLIPK